MRIQHNIAALNAYRNLSTNNNAVSGNLEKLASGYRINRAGDDAAGLAISEKMRAQITGLETAQKNSNDGISLVKTAEGALTEVHSMLNRMIELADQSSNGTYQDKVDRESLQEEVASLKDEIDRISQNTNFNGINLLDGSVNVTSAIKTESFQTVEEVEQESGNPGFFRPGRDVDGEYTGAIDAIDYEAKVYVGDITNTSGGDKTLVINYKDNLGTAKKVTLKVAAGKTATTEDVANALSTGATAGDVQFTNDDGAAMAAGAGGKFKDLYDVSFDGNIISIKAKADKTGLAGGDRLDGSKLGSVTVTNDFDAADVTKATETLKEKYDGTTQSPIGFGVLAGQESLYVDGKKASYRVASREYMVVSGLTGEGAHNMSIGVGDKTYVIQNEDEEVKGAPADAVIVRVDANDDNTEIAKKLAAAITATEGTNGNYVATANGRSITISESTNRGQQVLDGTEEVGKSADVAFNKKLILEEGGATSTGRLATFDASAMADGTTISVGDKTYAFVTNPSKRVEDGVTKIVYSESDDSAALAQKLAARMTLDGFVGVSANGASVDLLHSNIVEGDRIIVAGQGLSLQIGETADGFSKMAVKINATTTEALGIADVDVSTAAQASVAVESIKNAINEVSGIRGNLGAIQNRLEHTINNLSVTSENMTAAESRIRDVDMAKEMMAYTKNNILVQASQAMLAQAGQLPQGVLQLLQ